MIIQKISLIVAICAERKIHILSKPTQLVRPHWVSKMVKILTINVLAFVFNNADRQ